MKKKIFSLMVLSSASTSFADVNLYGKVAVGLENDQFQNTTVIGKSSVQNYGAYFGIRGSDPVYGETSAIWQVEQSLDLASGQAYYNQGAGGSTMPNPNNVNFPGGRTWGETNVLASSESYLGLQGLFGRVRIGNLSNYMRSNMGAVDIYNYGKGVNGLFLWSRTNGLLPTAIKYDSTDWGDFNFSATYSFNNSGQAGTSGVGYNNSFGAGLNGYYSGGVYNLGVGWKSGGYSVQLGTTVWEQVGTYATNNQGMVLPYPDYPQAAYSNAYASRLEVGYDDPDGIILGAGLQIASGLGWNGWANSGGAFNNVVVNPNYNGNVLPKGMNNAQYQTQELATSIGWHLAEWTPKFGYVYGNDLMYGGDITAVATGQASHITNSGYQQLVAELDWNITPKTIAFVNYGQIWYGNLLQNINYIGTPNSDKEPFERSNASSNQSTVAVGFSHTF